MNASGLLLREDILDTAYVEEIYITPRNYLFHMNKLTDEKDLLDQKRENDTPPVTMSSIESGVGGFDLRQALINEQGKVNHSRMTDLELCRVIDEVLVPRYCRGNRERTIYDLPRDVRARMGEALWQENIRIPKGRFSASGFPVGSPGYLEGKTVTELQLRRCLCLQYDAAE